MQQAARPNFGGGIYPVSDLQSEKSMEKTLFTEFWRMPERTPASAFRLLGGWIPMASFSVLTRKPTSDIT
jgi:hypothetical protein